MRVRLGAFRIGCEGRVPPNVEPAGRNERRLLVLRHAGHPTSQRLVARHFAIGAKRAGSGLDQRLGLADPDRRVQRQPLDFAGVLRRIGRRRGGAPRPAQQVEARNVAALEDEVDHRADVLDGDVAAYQRRIVLRVFRHLLGPHRLAVTAQVDQIDIVAARRDVIHPRQAAELQVKRRGCRIGGAVDVEHRALRPERGHVGGPLVADVDLDAGVRRHHHLFRHQARRLRQRGSRHGRHCRHRETDQRIHGFLRFGC